MLQVENLSKTYRTSKTKSFTVVDSISFKLQEQGSLCLFGESGSGKSTIAQMIAGLIPPSSGTIHFNGQKLTYPMQKAIRPKIQIVFQHPESSFNPKLRIYDCMKEPYDLYQTGWTREDLTADLERVGLIPEFLNRYPNQLSGGELQRLSIVRALATKPSLLILDEAASMLDVVTQAKMIHLLKNYQSDYNLSYLFITHDPALSEIFSDNILKLS